MSVRFVGQLLCTRYRGEKVLQFLVYLFEQFWCGVFFFLGGGGGSGVKEGGGVL